MAGLRVGEHECGHRGCTVPVKRLGGLWWHVRKAGAHKPRPKPDSTEIPGMPRG